MKSPATTTKKNEKQDHRRNDIERKPLTCITKGVFDSTHNQSADERRKLRSGYGAILNLIKERADEIGKNTDKFKSIMDELDEMHKNVKKPREQIADAEALSGVVSSFETALRSGNNGFITPADFVSCLLKKFGEPEGTGTHENANKHIRWKELGRQVSPVFRSCVGCSTMLGPMKTEFKQRKVPICRKLRTRRPTKAEPEQYDSIGEEKADTDLNMAVMFKILREKKIVKLENLLLNRKSFAQTVENLFALSFLVKDGRVLIAVDEKGSHLVSPRNAPHSRAVMSGEVVNSHFIFRFDFCDWKFMKALVAEGEELMPVRNGVKLQATSQEELVPMNSQSELPLKTYARKLRVLVEEKRMGKECPEVASYGV